MKNLSKKNRNIKLPNFLVVGAPKSGSSSLFYYLKQHPEIFMPMKKEPQFFSYYGLSGEAFSKAIYPNRTREFIQDFDRYKSLFSTDSVAKAIGEASTSYLFFYQRSIDNIKKFLPNFRQIKIIIILRNPIDASFSHYSMYKMRGGEKLAFEEAIIEEDKRVETGFYTLVHFVRFMYYNQVKEYLKNFDHVRIILLDKLKRDTVATVKALYKFLDVDPAFTPELGVHYNPSGIPKNKLSEFIFIRNPFKDFIRPLLNLLIPEEKWKAVVDRIKAKNLTKTKMRPETREYLKKFYGQDILNLEDLIHKDLSNWLR